MGEKADNRAAFERLCQRFRLHQRLAGKAGMTDAEIKAELRAIAKMTEEQQALKTKKPEGEVVYKQKKATMIFHVDPDAKRWV